MSPKRRRPLIGLAAIAALALAACSSGHPATVAATSRPATTAPVAASATAAAAAASAACPAVMTTVNGIASGGGIDLAAGAMSANIGSDQVLGWASELNDATKTASAHADQASLSLASDVLLASLKATALSYEVGGGTASETHSDAVTFIKALQKVQADCGQ